ncbi:MULTISPECIES: hypothetical protein [Achromobacter]|uniref:hypothetical protein n=1 Tax=Achromobacter TaxID=222 RepID=UPI0023F73CD5|nr:hypothetical protein [Achromobacter anxifer]MDF8363332.1 hypothetical protein [Achromobacter anxifer]
MNMNHTLTSGDCSALLALADRIDASKAVPIPIDASAAQLLRNLIAGYHPSVVPVAYQVRRLDATAQWEPCTLELYEATLQTGRYCGLKNGPQSEVRALGVINAQDLPTAVSVPGGQ